MTTHMVTDPDAIRDVLACDLAVPPHRPGDGAALELRAAMARFAVPAEHGPRRASVEEVLAELDVTEVRELAGRAAEDEFVLIGDAVELGRMVPVRVLLAALGLVPIDDAAAGEAAGADVDAIAAVIASTSNRMRPRTRRPNDYSRSPARAGATRSRSCRCCTSASTPSPR